MEIIKQAGKQVLLLFFIKVSIKLLHFLAYSDQAICKIEMDIELFILSLILNNPL